MIQYGARLLLQVPREGGNQERAEGHSEEQAARNPGGVPQVRDQSLQNWQVLAETEGTSSRAVALAWTSGEQCS